MNTKGSCRFYWLIHFEHCWDMCKSPRLTMPTAFSLYFQYNLDDLLDTLWLLFRVSQVNRSSNWIFWSYMCILSCIHSSVHNTFIELINEQDSGIKTMKDAKMTKKRSCSQRVFSLEEHTVAHPSSPVTNKTREVLLLSFPLSSSLSTPHFPAPLPPCHLAGI